MSVQKEHPSLEELTAFSVGMLSSIEASVVESHIGECSPCCETLLGLSSDDTFVGILQQVECSDDAMPIDLSVSTVSTEPNSEETIKHVFANHPRYEVKSWIARGGMGDVFKAEHRSMGRTVALKVINRGLIRNSQVVERFHREVRTAARLSHPNIVTAYDAEQSDNIHFLVMEYVAGVNLATLVKERKTIPVFEACDYARQAAIGLQYAHEQGVVHRDIKPHNLMLTAGTVKILDFGLASLAEVTLTSHEKGEVPESASLTATGSIMGTPDFMSPEQATNSNLADVRSDIYSLGATLYYLLAGQPPFSSGSVMDRLKRHADSEPKSIRSLRSDVPQELEAIVSRMMSKNPDQRFQSSQEVALALTRFTACAPITPSPQVQSSLGGRNWWPFGTVKTIVGASAAAFSLVLAGIVFVETDKGTLVIESVDDSVKVVVSQARDESGGTYIQTNVIDTITGSEVKRLPSGEYKLSLASDGNQYELNQDGFVLRRGAKVVATVTRKESTETNSEPIALKKIAMPAMDQQKLILKGPKMSEPEIKELQTKADSDPNDFESRLLLLGYYSRNSIMKRSLREPHQKVAIWFIENYPESEGAGRNADLMGTINPIGYVSARESWLRQLKVHDQNVAVILNAADFFLMDDREKAEELYKKAQELEPDNPAIAQRLAHLYQLSGRLDESKKMLQEQNEKSMVQFERALTQTKEGQGMSHLLSDIAKTAYKLGQLDKAKQFADRLLKEYSDGDAVHHGNTVLGLIALQAGDIEAAGKYLLESGKTEGSPVLKSFGPSMLLAKELLEKGQKDTVLEYFDLCEKFWTIRGNKLMEWRETVKAGGTPNFVMNLR